MSSIERRGGPADWLLPLVAFGLLAVANGRWQIWPAAWLAPIFLVLFLESQPARRGLFVGLVAQLFAFFLNWWGMIPVPGAWYFLVAGIYGTVYFLPFVLHRLTVDRIDPSGTTLILPVSWVAVEFVFQRLFTPYGSWASLTYTQVDHLPLLQLASITGTSGISFLILWCAAVVASLWRNRDSLRVARSGALLFLAVLAAVLVWGQVRIASAPEPRDESRIAGVTPSKALTRELESSFRPLVGGTESDDAARIRMIEAADRLHGDLLDRTRRAAEAGAQIVIWSEHAARVTRETEPAFIREAGELARDLEIVLILGVGKWNPGATPAFENKLIALEKNGEIAFSYAKARPIVGSESSLIPAGDASLGMMETRSGLLATVICHDLDFPDFVRSAGKLGVSLLVGPSSDWPEIASLHARMARVRAVENGCSLVRPCADGLSIVVDPVGRIVAEKEDRGDRGSALSAAVGSHRIETLYPRIGDLFEYANLAGLPCLIWWSRRRFRRDG